MPFFLGVDAGGTKAEFLLGDESRELARVRTGTIKRMRADAETVEANLDGALRQLTAASGVAMQSITRCRIGTAGETVPLVTDWLREAFGRRIGGELEIVGDVEIAVDAAFRGQRGVLVLAGTGSNVAGRASDGTIVTAGGWGPILADQGSGHFIGVEGLRRGVLAIDQQRPTRLLHLAMQHWQLDSLGALIERANARPGPDYSKLAPLFAAAADEGDVVAQEVLALGGADLAFLAGLVITRIRTIESPSDSNPFVPPAVAITGSVIERVSKLREAMYAVLRRTYPGINLVEAPADPPAGALWGARGAKNPAAA
ncbi:MAG TPA: BadF/BadG/BcrA/BcrD ATPase family protein [Terracidiphilus sp.]|jgi:N-acetylglucosamine kinase-like BadF-type ATPase|nr:BadF/BadG/BcrA/BcrD ATPase family protein [Terracidiphilus sp.]